MTTLTTQEKRNILKSLMYRDRAKVDHFVHDRKYYEWSFRMQKLMVRHVESFEYKDVDMDAFKELIIKAIDESKRIRVKAHVFLVDVGNHVFAIEPIYFPGEKWTSHFPEWIFDAEICKKKKFIKVNKERNQIARETKKVAPAQKAAPRSL